MLSGCARESVAERAAKMEMDDDASCQRLSASKGAQAYNQCRANLLVYRREVAEEDAAHQRRAQAIGDGLKGAGAALCGIGSPEGARAGGC